MESFKLCVRHIINLIPVWGLILALAMAPYECFERSGWLNIFEAPRDMHIDGFIMSNGPGNLIYNFRFH